MNFGKVLAVCLVCLPSVAAASPLLGQDAVRIGVNEEDVVRMPENLLSDLKTFLSKSLPEYTIETVILPEEQLRRQSASRKLEFVLSSSSLFRQIQNRGKDMATLTTEFAQNSEKAEGAAIFAKAADKEIRRLEDLKKKSMGIAEGVIGTSLLALYWELSHLTKTPLTYFERINRKKESIESVLQGLKDGKYQAVVLPVCALETFAKRSGVDTSWLKVVNRKSDSALRCTHSTNLFPGLTIFALPHTQPDLSRAVSLSLTSATIKTNDNYGWSVASDFSRMDRLLRYFDLDPDAKSRKWSINRFVREYWHWAFLLVALIAGLMLHSIRTEALVRSRTKKLEKALEDKSRFHRQAREFSKRLERVKTIGTLGQMSSLFAHELRQPLNSIICFAYSLRKAVSQEGKLSTEDLKEGLDEIQYQAKRANEIVTRVRQYVRSKSSKHKEVDLFDVLDRSIYEFESTTTRGAQIHLQKPKSHEGLMIFGDSLELELIFINLLRNAVEAQDEESEPNIDIKLSTEDGYCKIIFADNGPKPTPELISRLSEVMETTKPEGLGLGLSIVRMLLEEHSGKLFFEGNDPTGLKAVVLLPLGHEG